VTPAGSNSPTSENGRKMRRRPTTTSPTLTTRVRDTLERIAAPQPAERYEAIFTNDRNSFPAR